MKPQHSPSINLRYWTAITLASVFGTNLGDFYARVVDLGLGTGLLVLLALTALVFLAERFSDAPSEILYWLVIVLIRTGATNIADFFAYTVRVPGLPLTLGLAALLAAFAALAQSRQRIGLHGHLPATNAADWLAMLSAGIFGTVLGDITKHTFGKTPAALGLLALLLVSIALFRSKALNAVVSYWLIVAVARTAGTAIGDWLAGKNTIGLGLNYSTLLTGLALLATLVLWRPAESTAPALVPAA